ncbi:cytochrome P450 [Streptomyces sp. B-S-A8]|uniref:Cytochrome P450 n=1 Tax=Streptomyces solicavernae TaxID=3043614 RepID=A0ABT6RNQ8_9ACTN|nr:cytochrome P450 [Streptomyces sp. B-S-A8]MDI3386053.1 cytochrome P450 [Streptomyces sp. B-S-A8]
MTSEPRAPFGPGTEPASDETVHCWSLDDLQGLDFDPFLHDRLRDGRATRVQLPFGEGSAWLMASYAHVKAATTDPRFSRAELVGRTVTSSSPHAIASQQASLNYADPPRLNDMRRVVARAFTGKSMHKLRPAAQRTADGLLDAMERHGSPADLVEHLHGPFPLAAVADLLGMDQDMRKDMTSWANLIMTPGPAPERSSDARMTVRECVVDLLARRREEPRDDLAGVLAAASDAGEITEPEAVSLATAILVSGAHAVRNNSANMVYALLTHPRQLERLRAEPELIPQAVDELLRYIPHRSGVGLPRIATQDVEIAGVVVRAGEAVYSSYLAANRDPEAFPEPDALDFDRGPIAHMAFGNGPHHCVGSMLARMESEIILATLLDRYPTLALAVPPERIEWQTGGLIRGPKALPVSW